ncbi:MAG: hypothetical protein ACOYB3_01645 [Azonexus sp.]
MAQFTVYSSSDTGAPTCTGEVGSLVALLDACLVNGYGAKAAAGWTKPYTGANKAVFKQGAGSCGFYLRVQDDAPGTGGAREARITGYEVMTDVDTGVNSFPMAISGQGLNSGAIAAHNARKSDTADAVTRPWYVFADSMTVYFWASPSYPTIIHNLSLWGFGDFYSYAPGTTDAYRCFLAGHDREQAPALQQDYGATLARGTLAPGTWLRATSALNPVVARPYGGIGYSTVFSTMGDYTTGNLEAYCAGNVQCPNPANGGVHLNRWRVAMPGNFQIRGTMRGFYQWGHSINDIDSGTTFNGSGEFAGKTFMAVKTVFGCPIFEISDTLDTNT